MKYITPKNLSLLEALTHVSPQSSKTTLRSWIKDERVQVDGIIVKLATLTVLEGQCVQVNQRKKFIAGGIRILYEDSDLVVIHKPTGLLSVSSNFEKGETAHALLREYYKPRRLQIVHRLDQDTSGVMLFALSPVAYEKLKKMFETHEIERSYTAIVEGKVASSEGTWQSYLYEDEQYVVHSTENEEEGRLATTHFETKASNKRYSWLVLNLETGRKNQIRVHCQDAGHPVVGDKKYGSHSNPIKRLCLHAHLLTFKHPVSHKLMRFESPVPEDFFKLINPH